MSGGIGGAGISDARLQLAPGVKIGYVMRDAKKWEVDTERYA